MPATSVISRPTAGAMISDEAVRVRPPAGRANPNAENMAFKPTAMPTPATTPSREAITPTIRVSSTMEPSTCRRDAPTARSRAESRFRWAMMIEKVLLMLKAATSRAIPPNTPRNVRRKPRKSLLISSLFSSTSSWPVRTSTSSPKASSRLSRNSVADTPSSASTSTLVAPLRPFRMCSWAPSRLNAV